MQLQPVDILLGNAHYAARLFLLRFANARQPFAGHLRIVGALVIVGVNEDVNVVLPLGQQGQGSGATERVVVRMRSEQQDGLLLQLLELQRRFRGRRHRRKHQRGENRPYRMRP